MKTCGLFLILLFLHAASWAQSTNLGFEQVDAKSGRPLGWQIGDGGGSYQVVADSLVRQEGRYSLRLAANSALRSKAYGVAAQQLPVTFKGKTLKLSAYLKTDKVTQGYARLLLRVDGPNGPLAFDDMHQNPVRGTTDWQQYSVSVPLTGAAQSIYFGGILPAKGTLWLDRLVLTVDDQPLPAPLPAEPFKAEQDTAFRHGSGLTLDNLSKQQIDNLAVLGRVWGFVKYYHPAVARGDYNLDAELLRVLPKVLATKDLKARSEVLGAWVTSLGPVPACPTCHEPDSTRLQPDLAWLTDKSQLSPALSQQLVYLRHNRNQGPHYYIGAVPRVGNPIFTHEEAYASPETPDAGLRVLALFRYWNMIDYFFPYRYAIGKDWQAVLPEFIPQFVAARTPAQYRLTALALISRIHDTHASILNDKLLNDYKGDFYAPLWIRFVDGQAVVAGYYDAALGAATTLQLGDIIVQVDGQPVADIIKVRQPITPASNEPTQLRNIARDLLRGPTRQVALVVRRAGRELPVTVGRMPASQLNSQISFGTPDPHAPAWKLLPGNIGYLALGTIHNAEIPQIMAAAQGTKGLIIDLRNYPAEFVVFSLSRYLLDQPKPFVRFSQLQLTYPGFFDSRSGQQVAPGPDPAYPGKVIILVNELTQSSAEYHAMALRTAPRATVVGSTTAGADGNVSAIVLPGNINTRITGIGIYYPDGRETQRVGIVPDVEVKPTIKGIAEGRDEVLEKAVQLVEAG